MAPTVNEGIGGVIDFVADAPQDDRRMVAIPQHHILGVADAPDFESLVVSAARHGPAIAAFGPLAFAADPFVEGFVHHQQTHAVAEVVKLGRHRVVGAAYGVDTDLLESLEAAFQRLLDEGRAKCAEVVMNADSLHLDGPPIQDEPLVRAEVESANPERSALVVYQLPVEIDAAHRPVQTRLIGRPEAGVGNRKLLGEGAVPAGRDGLFRLRAGGFLRLLVEGGYDDR